MKNRSFTIKLMVAVRLLLAVAFVMTCDIVAHAQVINFDVDGGYANLGLGGPGNFSGLGAYADLPANTYWNPANIGGTTSANLLSDGTTSSSVSFTESEAGHYDGGGTGTPGEPSALEAFFAYANNLAVRGCSLSNIPPGTYALYLYGKNDNGGDGNRGTTFTVSNDVMAATSQSTVNSKTADTAFVLGNDYVVFNGVTVSSEGYISFTYTANTNATTYNNPQTEGDFNGLQLVKVIAVPPPGIHTQPFPQKVYSGKTVTFNCLANGNGGTLSYQWTKNGSNLSDGATGTGSSISGSHTGNLTISTVGNNDAANYALTVTSTIGTPNSTNSGTAQLSIAVPNGPYENEVVTTGPLHFYRFDELGDPATNNTVAFDYAGGDLGVYGTGCMNGNPTYSIAGPTPSSGWPGFYATNTAVSFAGPSPNRVVSITSPWSLNTDTVTITAWVNPSAPAVNQDLVFVHGATTVTGIGYGPNLDTNGNPTLGYTWNDDPATTDWSSGLEAPVGVWSFVALTITSSNATINLMNQNGLLSATHVYPHPPQAFNDPTAIGDDPTDTTGANSFGGTMDDVAVYSRALSAAELLDIFTNASGIVNYGPSIGVQPYPASLYPGETATFSVNAGGTPPLSYQWQEDTAGNNIFVNLANGPTGGGSVVNGANSATLSIANIGSADGNNYRVIVSSPYGSPATSSAALLTLLSPLGGAQNITLQIQMGADEDWNATTNWSTGMSANDSAGAYPGSTFEVLPNALLRSPDSSTNITFPGVQLTIDGTNLPNAGELQLDHISPTTTFAFSNLTLAGGRVDNGNDGMAIIAGSITVVSNSTFASDPDFSVINFDVPGSYSENYVGQGAFKDYGYNYWNPIVNNGVTADSLLDDATTPSPITFSDHVQFTYNPGGGVQREPSGLETAYEGITSSGKLTNSINHVPAGTYDLYVYGVNGAAGNHDRGTSFTVSTDITGPVTNSTLNTLAGFNQFIEGNDYVVFRNVAVGPGGTITFWYTANPLAGNGNSGGVPNPPPNTEADFNGVQLVALVPSATGRPMRIDAQLSGSGTIRYSAPDTNYQNDLIINNSGNTFSGQWDIVQGTVLGSATGSLGSNNITVEINGALETLYNVNNPNSTLFVYGKVFLHQNDVFQSMFVNGTPVPAGVYTAAQLALSYPANFPSSWMQQTGSSVSTSSGSIQVLSSGPPFFSQNVTPQAVTLYQEQTAQFSVVVIGQLPITYQWRENGAPLSDGNNPSLGTILGSETNVLTISNITAAAGTYNIDLVATNSSGVSTSSVAVLTVLQTSPPTTATLTDVQAPGNDWDTASDWDLNISASQLAAEYPGSTNIVPPGTVLRSPDVGTSLSFPGQRLIIEGDGNFSENGNGLTNIGPGSTMSEFRTTEPGNVSIYVPDLQMAGGQLDNSGNNVGNPNASQSLGMLTISGRIDILSNTTFYSDSSVRAGSLRAIEIDALLTGKGAIAFSTFDTTFTNDLNITGTANTFSGQWDIVQGALLGSGVNSLGTNSITVETNGALETTYNINNPNASLVVNGGQVFLHTGDTFGSVTINGTQLSPGTYSWASLNSSFPTTFPATWLMQIGSSVNTGSGSITVGSAPASAARITGIHISGGNVSISGTNGTSGAGFRILSSTNATLPLSSWTQVGSSSFSGNGNFTNGVPYNSAEPHRFYIIVSP